MAWRLTLTQEQARQLNDKLVEMLLNDEDPGQLMQLLEKAAIEDEADQ